MSRNIGSRMRAEPGPWRTTSCEAYYFLLDASNVALQKLVDNGLNRAAGFGRFKVTVDAVAMTFQTFRNMHIVGADASSPILNYLETAFFVMVSDTQQGGRVFIWAPYMYCNDSMATISGREVYGFPKEFSTIAMDGKVFNTRAWGLANTPALQREPVILPITQGGVIHPHIEYAPHQLTKPIDLAQIRQDRLLESFTGFWGVLGGLDSALGQWVGLMIDPAIPFVFNRSQFRAATGAWSSELLYARSPVNQFAFDQFVIPLAFTIANTPSHPVMSELGLVPLSVGAEDVQPLFGCKMTLDFSLVPPQPL